MSNTYRSSGAPTTGGRNSALTASPNLTPVSYTVTHCDFCGKAILVLEVQEKTIDGIVYNLCEYCVNFNSYAEVVASYNSDLMSMWSGLEPKAVNYL